MKHINLWFYCVLASASFINSMSGNLGGDLGSGIEQVIADQEEARLKAEQEAAAQKAAQEAAQEAAEKAAQEAAENAAKKPINAIKPIKTQPDKPVIIKPITHPISPVEPKEPVEKVPVVKCPSAIELKEISKLETKTKDIASLGNEMAAIKAKAVNCQTSGATSCSLDTQDFDNFSIIQTQIMESLAKLIKEVGITSVSASAFYPKMETNVDGLFLVIKNWDSNLILKTLDEIEKYLVSAEKSQGCSSQNGDIQKAIESIKSSKLSVGDIAAIVTSAAAILAALAAVAIARKKSQSKNIEEQEDEQTTLFNDVDLGNGLEFDEAGKINITEIDFVDAYHKAIGRLRSKISVLEATDGKAEALAEAKSTLAKMESSFDKFNTLSRGKKTSLLTDWSSRLSSSRELLKEIGSKLIGGNLKDAVDFEISQTEASIKKINTEMRNFKKNYFDGLKKNIAKLKSSIADGQLNEYKTKEALAQISKDQAQLDSGELPESLKPDITYIRKFAEDNDRLKMLKEGLADYNSLSPEMQKALNDSLKTGRIEIESLVLGESSGFDTGGSDEGFDQMLQNLKSLKEKLDAAIESGKSLNDLSIDINPLVESVNSNLFEGEASPKYTEIISGENTLYRDNTTGQLYDEDNLPAEIEDGTEAYNTINLDDLDSEGFF